MKEDIEKVATIMPRKICKIFRKNIVEKFKK